MSLVKDTGIVIESREWSEIDSALTLLSYTGFKHRILVKGIRKSKTRPIVASEIGSIVELEYYKHPNKEIFPAKDIFIKERFEGLKSSYLGFLVVHSICELTNRLTQPGEENSQIYKLITFALKGISDKGFFSIALPHFKLKLLTILGLAPKDFYCHSCEEEIFHKTGAHIPHGTLDVYCADCRPSQTSQLETIKLLNAMNRKSYNLLLMEEIPSILISEADKILDAYIRLHFGIEWKSLEILYTELSHSKYQKLN
jgi:DNA repair protein RecO (recombination protein O)